MKSLKSLAIVIASILFLSACQKELSFESGFYGGRGKGSLFSASGECNPVDVQGDYITDTVLNDNNFVNVTVNVTNPGTYYIYTETKNGFSFSDSAVFISVGPQTVKLKGVGKPIAVQQTLFTVAFDTSVCSFAVDVYDSLILPAQYTFAKDTTGSCAAAVVQGLYKENVPLNSTNTVDVNIHVNAHGTGKYNLVTDTIAGMWFKTKGIVFDTGNQVIRFTGYGKPDSNARGIHVFTISNGVSTCGFSIKVDSSAVIIIPPGNPADSAWSFSQGANFFHGRTDSAQLVASPLGGSLLTVTGATYPGADTSLTIVITLPGSTVQPGTYATNTGFTNAFSFDAITAATNVYSANFGTAPAVMTMVITSYDATTKIVKGTFSGSVQDSAGATVPITNGKFEAAVQ